MNSSIEENDVIKMVQRTKLKLAQLFTNLLWAHTPHNWTTKGVFANDTLYIIMALPRSKRRKIRRKFSITTLQSREKDLWGMAQDCVQQIRSEINKEMI